MNQLRPLFRLPCSSCYSDCWIFKVMVEELQLAVIFCTYRFSCFFYQKVLLFKTLLRTEMCDPSQVPRWFFLSFTKSAAIIPKHWAIRHFFRMYRYLAGSSIQLYFPLIAGYLGPLLSLRRVPQFFPKILLSSLAKNCIQKQEQ